jgi:hypothetical protein
MGLAWRLDLSASTGDNFEHQQSNSNRRGAFVAGALDQFCLATKFGFEHDELGDGHQCAGAEFHKSSGRNFSFSFKPGRLFSPLGTIAFSYSGNLFLESGGAFLQSVWPVNLWM